MATWQGGEYNVERGGRKGKDRKGKGEKGNGGVALAPREKFLWAPMLQFIMACHIVYGRPYCNDAKEGVGGITPPKLNRGG